MRLEEIYELCVKKGLEKDPRNKKELKETLGKIRLEYRNLKPEEKRYFDKEKFRHPYADTRILYGGGKKHIRTIMVGIDIDAGEILTAYLLNEKGAGIDLIMSHHPLGAALANLPYVMNVQMDMLKKLGIGREVASSLMKERMDEVSRRVSPLNSACAVDIARLLDIPLMCVHTPADNHVTHFLQKLFDRKKPKRIKDVLKDLRMIPEYQDGMTKGAGPRLLSGKDDNRAGKVFVDMTGGTEGPKRIFARLSQAGVGTIVAMHLSEEHFKIAKDEFINLIIAGHIASDNLGLNLVLDELAKAHDFKIIPCAGFVRVKR